MSFTVRGTILQTPRPGDLEIQEDQVVTVGDDGVIVSIAPGSAGTRGAGSADHTLAEGSVLLPGLIDTHLHAPQWPQLGTGLDLPLEDWLFAHTFPLEARYVDETFAKSVWAAMVPTLLAGGTTTAVYYGSIHEPATLALAETCLANGQRAFVGRVAMDHPEGTPEWYRDPDPSSSVEASARSIEAISALAPPLGAPLVQAIVTPRFIPACSDAALEGLAELADSTGTRIQTHCSESDWEHGYVFDRHGCSDAESLRRFGIVRDHAVLAHATHLDDADRAILVEAGAGVAHCPLSNSYFSNAVFQARRGLDVGLRMGLGSDVAGGSESSLLRQCQHAVTSSRMLEDGTNADVEDRGAAASRIDIATAFWLATVGGADLLGIPAGLLEPGRVFDAIVVDVSSSATIGRWPELDDWDRTFEKIVRRSTAADITTVWVNGVDVTPDKPSG